MPERSNWPLILLLWLAGLGAAGQYAKISVIFDRLPEVYPDAGAGLGFVVSLVGAVGILLGVVAGVLVARVGLGRAVIWALWIGAALTLAQAVFPPLPVFLALRLAEGAAHLALVVAIPTLMASFSSEAGRGLALTLWSTFFSVAFALLTWVGLPLISAFGPGAVMVLHGGWMVLMALILSFVLPRGAGVSTALSWSELLATHARIYRSPYLSAPAMGWLCYTVGFLAILTLIPPFLPEAGRALILGLLPIMAILSSMTVGVWALRRFGTIPVVTGSFILSAGLSLCMVLNPASIWLPMALFAALGLVQGASFAAVPVLNETEADRALANGGMAQMGNLGNVLGTPVFVLVVATAGLPGMMAVCALIFGMGAVFHLVLAARRAGP